MSPQESQLSHNRWVHTGNNLGAPGSGDQKRLSCKDTTGRSSSTQGHYYEDHEMQMTSSYIKTNTE